MPVGCYKQMSAIKEGVTMRLQCICKIYFFQNGLEEDDDEFWYR